MDFLKMIFPIAFNSTEKNNFITSLVIHIVASILGGVLLALIGVLDLPLLGVLLGLIGSVLDAYCVGGIVISILVFVKVIKV